MRKVVIKKSVKHSVVKLDDHERAALEIIANIDCNGVECDDCPLYLYKSCISGDACLVLNSYVEENDD